MDADPKCPIQDGRSSAFHAASCSRFRCIVADPPWPIGNFPAWFAKDRRSKRENEIGVNPTPYKTMTLPEIERLRVADVSADGAHLYLWTTDAFYEAALRVARAWGFEKSATLVWCKKPMGLGLGGTFCSNTEFILFCRRGTLKAKRKVDTRWWGWPRGKHSEKPEAFQNIVEQVSPGPYLELFARRQRMGWSTWGNEVPCDVQIDTSNAQVEARRK